MNELLPMPRRDAPDLATSRTRAVWRSGAWRWVLAVLVGCVALLAAVPVAAATPGAISGTVTEAEGAHKGLAEVLVLVQPPGTGQEPAGSPLRAKTNGNGEYTVTGLPEGEYTVFFFGPGNFVAHYYNEKISVSEATPVPVAEGITTPGINAALQVGGQISGMVTDAVTHKGLANIEVVACSIGGPQFACRQAFTIENGNIGEYTVNGLITGSYEVEFARFENEIGHCCEVISIPRRYIEQFYNNEPSEASADLVAVTRPSVTPGIDAALIPTTPPNNTGSPVASGTPSVGQTLSCSNGSWTGTPTLTYAYEWLRDGSAIAGASGSTYVVQSADQGHGLTCEVTATNSVGHAAATSNTLTVPAAPAPPPPKEAAAQITTAQITTLLRQQLTPSGPLAQIGTLLKSGVFSTSFRALQAGTAVINWYQVPPGAKLAKKAKPKPVLVASGKRSFSAAGTAKIKIKLTAAGKRLLKHAKKLKLTAKGTFTPTGKAPITTTKVFVLKRR